jgi:hypothetical protein
MMMMKNLDIPARRPLSLRALPKYMYYQMPNGPSSIMSHRLNRLGLAACLRYLIYDMYLYYTIMMMCIVHGKSYMN